MKRTLTVLTMLLLLLSSCATSGRRMITNAADLGPGQVIVTGKINVIPPFTDKEQELSGFGSDDYRNVMLILNGRNFKKINITKTQALTGREWEGRIPAKMGEVFYAVFQAGEPLYLLSGAICTKYYYVTVPGTTTWMDMGNGMMTMVTNPPTSELRTKFEYIPFNYKIETAAGDRAVYIGDINIYRDEFNKITKMEVVDNYSRHEAGFNEKFSEIKLKRTIAKAAPENELIQPTEADFFMNSGYRSGFGGGYSFNTNGSGGYINAEVRMGYQFSRNFTGDLTVRLMASPQFFSYTGSNFAGGVSLGSIDAPITIGGTYYLFDGTISPYVTGRLGAALDISTERAMASFFKTYLVTDLALGVRFSLDTHFDLMLEGEEAVYNFVPVMFVPKLVLLF